MNIVVFDGEKEARRRELALKKKVKKLGKKLKLVSVVVSDDKASHLYVDLKGEACRRVGIDFEKIEFEDEVEAGVLINSIKAECEKEDVTGVMVQMPLPEGLKKHEDEILSAIDLKKDVDGLSPKGSKFLPATVKAVMSILASEGVALRSKRVVVVGRSRIVGKPLFNHLKSLGVDVKMGHSKTSDLGKLTRNADVLISATGVAGLIKANAVKKGAVVIDVGEPRGDVDFDEVKKKAWFITPVPGGVGPMTVVSLLENVFQAVII